MTVAIKVENLSKKYIIQHEKKSAHYETLSESLIQGSKNVANRIIHPFSKAPNPARTEEEFWALKDINFEINQGDKVGIIGRNGAGKSTLLKVLSRITDPTSGKIHINGRIASLLEVGTGFHPELTGRENIYLNGAILGMSRKEIKSKFDEIVAFAEVEKFLDTPVKRYSSGMYVRLAFAVAAHLESEILVVDEVLAVGDVEFQKKCLGKMGDVSKEGRTILFVSHNMNAIEQLCENAIVLDSGNSLYYAAAKEAIGFYLKQLQDKACSLLINEMPRINGCGEKIRISNASLINTKGLMIKSYKARELIILALELKFLEYAGDDIHINISVYDIQQLLITTVTSRTEYGYIKGNSGDTLNIQVSMDSLLLTPGEYNISVTVGKRGHYPYDVLKHILAFSVLDTAFQQKIDHPNLPGIFQTNASWKVQ